MPLANMREMLLRAQLGEYALGSFCVANMECIQGIISAAEEQKSPVIIQLSEQRMSYSPLNLLGPMMLAAARDSKVPIGVHLDHGKTISCVKEALALGFTSVMYDGSSLGIRQNIENTRTVIELARQTGAAVEAEVGAVGSSEIGKVSASMAADINECLLMSETGVDAIAVAIGNMHGLYAKEPRLRYDILDSLRGRMHAHLVLHGGTGLTDDQFRTLITLGMQKINIGTDVYMAAASPDSRDNVFANISAARNRVSAVVQRYITLFGSAGKAE